MSKEKWRPIHGFPNYQVSNWGHVYNTKFHRQISTKANEITLSEGFKRKSVKLSRLVWDTFKGSVGKYTYIIHLNGDLNDNHLSNLALKSSSYALVYESLDVDNHVKRDPEKHYRQHIREFIDYVESKYGHDWHTKISNVDDPKVERWYRFIYKCR